MCVEKVTKVYLELHWFQGQTSLYFAFIFAAKINHQACNFVQYLS